MRMTAFACDGPIRNTSKRKKPCDVIVLLPTNKDGDWTCPLHGGDADLSCLGDFDVPDGWLRARDEERRVGS